MKHKHAELIKQWADGAEIERLNIWISGHKTWEPEVPLLWNEDHKYRIKPEEKQPVVRWLWAFETDVNTWEQYSRFMTEEEARKRLACKYRYSRIDWSRTEFPE